MTADAVNAAVGRRAAPPQSRRDWRVVPMLLPYLWEYKWRVVIALVFLVAGKQREPDRQEIRAEASACKLAGSILIYSGGR